MSRARGLLLAALCAGAAAWLSATPARAQMAHVPETDWRQVDRHDAIVKAAQKPTWTVEIRFGTYLPSIDSAVGNGKTPFADIYGLDCTKTPLQKPGSVSPRVLGGFEVDYLPVRIPFIGALGAGVGWSFTSFSNAAQLQVGGSCSAENTTLQIMPMYGTLVLRADELMRRTGIPLVPYGKFGVGVAWWRASTDTGTEQICGTTSTSARCTAGSTSVLGHGDGITPSLHFAVGGAIALNFLEPQAAARLDQTTGVRHAYAFGEYYNEQLTIAANVMHVGTSSWVAGLAVDF